MKTLAIYHPSAILRGDTPEARDELYKMLVEEWKSQTGRKAVEPSINLNHVSNDEAGSR
jgi:hypothetical protein